MKWRIAIGQRETRIEDRKIRTLEGRKGAAPEYQNRSKAGTRRHYKVQNRSKPASSAEWWPPAS
jgi:hypothetical protein